MIIIEKSKKNFEAFAYKFECLKCGCKFVAKNDETEKEPLWVKAYCPLCSSKVVEEAMDYSKRITERAYKELEATSKETNTLETKLNNYLDDAEKAGFEYISDNRFDIDLFIVPNRGIRLEGFKHHESTYKKYSDLLSINNLEVDDNQIFFEIWAVDKKVLKSKNLADHGFNYNDNNFSMQVRCLPAEIFKNSKEGDTVEMTIPICNADGTSLYMKVNFRLAQTEYRYARFGHFEDVLDDVTKNIK